MMLFWAVAGVFSAAAAALILARAAAATRGGPVADPTLPLYRRQLGEIDDLATRGLIEEPERKAAHAEAARRLLAAADAPEEAWSAAPGPRRAVLAVAVLAPAAALAVYLFSGSPGAPDQPYARRLAAWRAAEPARLAPPEMAAVLRAMTAERPKDAEGYHYLALAEAASDNPAGTVRAMRHAVRAAPARADLWELLGEAYIARDGKVGPEAVAAFNQVVKLDPASLPARYNLGRARIEAGDVEGGVAAWRALALDIPAADSRRAVVLAEIERARSAAAPPALAADQLTAVRGMVAGLAARLEADPSDPGGWVKLVRSYAVLGETAKRDAALASARARFAARSDVVADLDAAAKTQPMNTGPMK